MSLLRAFNKTAKAVQLADDEAASALVESGRVIARSVDEAVLDGNGLKASYLIPHMVNVLREMGATPAVKEKGVKKTGTQASTAPAADEIAEARQKRGWRSALG